MATVSKWALLNGQGVCVAVILWDGNTATYDPAPLTAVAYNPAVHVVAADPRVVNKATLTDKASQAIAANVAFIASTPTTVAQLATQAKAQAKQWNALAKIVLDQLDDTTGT